MRLEPRALALAGPLALLCGCLAGKLSPGLRKETLVVESEVSCAPSADPAPCRERAERQALSALLGLYVSSASAQSPEVDRAVLQQAKSFIKRSRVAQEPTAAAGVLRLRVEVLHPKLGRDLDSLGVVKPAGVEGSPRILISLRESGLGAGSDVGRASDALRRALSGRGYAGLDLSDRLNPKGRQSTGSRDEALAAGKASKAEVVVTGSAGASEVVDEALAAQGYHTFRAVVEAEALRPGGDLVAPVRASATAVDISPAGAAAKALENAAETAAAGLGQELAARYRERVEIGVLVLGLRRAEEVVSLLAAIRGVPGVAGAAVGKLTPSEAGLRVFVERLGADELAARLMQHVRGFSLQVRSVEPEMKLIELELGGEGSF